MTVEIITSIQAITDYKVPGEESHWSCWDGYKIITDMQEIFVAVDNSQSCCEDFGYFSSFEDPSEFIGAAYLGIELVDTALNVKKFNEEHEYGFDEGDVMFVNIKTSSGLFQVAVYNSHNGYYGHTAIVKSNELKHTVGL